MQTILDTSVDWCAIEMGECKARRTLFGNIVTMCNETKGTKSNIFPTGLSMTAALHLVTEQKALIMQENHIQEDSFVFKKTDM